MEGDWPRLMFLLWFNNIDKQFRRLGQSILTWLSLMKDVDVAPQGEFVCVKYCVWELSYNKHIGGFCPVCAFTAWFQPLTTDMKSALGGLRNWPRASRCEISPPKKFVVLMVRKVILSYLWLKVYILFCLFVEKYIQFGTKWEPISPEGDLETELGDIHIWSQS